MTMTTRTARAPSHSCPSCLGTGIKTSSEWETYWADRDRLAVAGLTDDEIDEELIAPEGPECLPCCPISSEGR